MKKVNIVDVKDIILELKDSNRWNEAVENNSDFCGKVTIQYAVNWMKLMQIELSKGNKLIDIAVKTKMYLNYNNMTGFMRGCAVNLISQCWKPVKDGEFENMIYYKQQYK